MKRGGHRGSAITNARAWTTLALTSLALAGFVPVARAAWTIVGTTTQMDGNSGYASVRVTVYPDSQVAVSDEHGDFIVSWSGRRGWVAMVAPEKGPNNQDWCLRFALPARPIGHADSTLDIGSWRIYPRTAVQAPFPPSAPPGQAMLPRLRLPGPRGGEPSQYRQELRVSVDIWGRASRITEAAGAPEPVRVRDALKDHLNKLAWVVQSDTPCGDLAPFSVDLRCFYQWQDSVWVPMAKWDAPANPPQPMPGRATGGPIPR